MGEERRLEPRLRAYRPVRLRQPKAPYQVVETLTKNLAAGGICCISLTPFPVSTEVRMDMTLAPGQEPIAVRGQTAWFRTIPHSDQFDMGIAFLAMSPHDKRRLSTYLEQLSRQTPLIPA